MTQDRLSWERDGRDWPNREQSAFVTAGGLRWHLQRMGAGPRLLMLHGTGASSHSWRDFAPALSTDFAILAPDLPGHGFTSAPPPGGMSLPGMARAVAALIAALDAPPDLVIGHSAGAAILTRLALDGAIAPRGLISLNGALLPWRGLPGHLFSPAAKLFAANPLVSRAIAWRANRRAMVEQLVANTGSRLEPRGVELYQRLVRSPAHVRASLSMMASWDLAPIAEGLPELRVPLFLVVATADATVSPSEARRVRERLPSACVEELPGLGHLAHEERPEDTAELVRRIARGLGLLMSTPG